MMRGLIIVVAILVAGGLQAAEVLTLKGGHRIEGEVVKERDDAILVDVGYDILRIPRSEILTRTNAELRDEPEPEAEQTDGFVRFGSAEKRGTVRELSAELGEAVVLVQTPSGLGSGFLINDEGYCVTNHHVIAKENRITVTIFRRRIGATGDFQRLVIKDVQIAAINPFFDLALLQVPKQEGYEFKTAALAPPQSIEVGDPVFAIGNPLGLERSVSEGIVSTNDRNLDGLVYLQTTAQINPGNSGGPLFDLYGRVVGVTSMKVTGAEGLGFAIPIDYLMHFLNHREAFGYDRNNPNTGFRYLDAPRRSTLRPAPEATAD
jgi:serine protease Do